MQCRPCCRQLLARSSSSPALPAVRYTPTRLSWLLDRKRYRRSGKYRVVRCSTKVTERRVHPSSQTRRYSPGRLHPCSLDEQPSLDASCLHRIEWLVQGSAFPPPFPE